VNSFRNFDLSFVKNYGLNIPMTSFFGGAPSMNLALAEEIVVAVEPLYP